MDPWLPCGSLCCQDNIESLSEQIKEILDDVEEIPNYIDKKTWEMIYKVDPKGATSETPVMESVR